ncbi:YwqG family protein [Raineya orbicola]|uniref:DUF1963 domain-containing protein n=1 Tax=Raineya orbicola TaxID=2016530 RepID=A0A2N3IJ83_9BACT|nr:DUF1963 domain-containing protein [Raineya orbicola]PKQ70366.1 hypothetical protein Rain11_0594 [Raineya orbicola]
MPLEFPEKLKPFEDKLLQSQTTAIQIIMKNGSQLEPWQSKIGGMPFLPLGVEYPKDTQGKYMYLLAQINFEEVPSAIEFLPPKGILQFYIADEEMYGFNYHNPTAQENFKVLFFPDVDYHNYQRDLPRLEKPEYLPIFEPFSAVALNFQPRKEYIGFSDYRIIQTLGEAYEQFENILYEYGDEYLWFSREFDAPLETEKIGGYASFTQEDPRKTNENLQKYDFLLLQLGSNDIMQWGDMGVANFFINSEKLKQKDFSDILYTWDCA